MRTGMEWKMKQYSNSLSRLRKWRESLNQSQSTTMQYLSPHTIEIPRLDKVFLGLKLQADILVSSQGACSQAIVNAGGPQCLVNPNTANITVTPGLYLACNHVIHSNCSHWNGGKGDGVSNNLHNYVSFRSNYVKAGSW